uniref:Uncharacterized protein n=1 Tax=Corvus moneduloides TaxID=1196302 RepID=A0A8C3E1M8_CORMO
MEGSLTSSQTGCFISFSTWQALVVTELTPEHHSTEKSQGWFTTYKLTEMLSWRYCLHGTATQLCSRNAPWISTIVEVFSTSPPALHSQKAKKGDLSADSSPTGSTYPVLQRLEEA